MNHFATDIQTDCDKRISQTNMQKIDNNKIFHNPFPRNTTGN